MRYVPALLCCFLLLLSSLRAQSGWFRLESGVTDDLTSIAFTSETRGFVVGTRNNAMSTSDGGGTWQSMTLPGTDDRWTLRHVEFPSSDIGFITGYRLYNSYYVSALFRTTDEGKTWQQVQLNYDEHFFYHTAFPSQHTGYLVASTTDPGGDTIVYGTIILKTTDAGITWKESYRQSDHMGGGDIVFRDSLHGIVIRSSLVEGFTDHTLLATSDGGDTWHTINPCPDRVSGCISLSGLAGVSDSLWVMSDNSAVVLRSTDDGETWDEVTYLKPFPSLETIISISFADSLLGYACGTPREEIFRTTDGGLSWSTQQSNAGEYLLSISSPGKTVAYACGTNGRIVKTVSGGNLNSDRKEDGSESTTITITPNPIENSANISFSPSTALQQLRLYDILGRAMLTEPVSPHASSISLDTSILPPGIYLCRLGDTTARFVVVR